MSTLQFIDDITRRLGDALPPGAERLRGEIEERLRSLLQRALADADFVTREEFEAQAAVLAETRTRLDALRRALEQDEGN